MSLRIYSLLIPLCLVFAVILTAQASVDHAQKYKDCMAMAGKAPAQALYYADRWIGGEKGGASAGHCRASALLGLGRAEAAAKLLEKLAKNMNGAETGLKADLYGQAAIAWKTAGELDEAYLAYNSAILGSGSFELYLGRGTLQILRGKYKAAVDDLSHAIGQDSQNYKGFLQRAKAHRKRRHFLYARLDLKQAQKLNKDSADIMLESGILYREQGNKADARKMWQALTDRYPGTDLAALAQENIDLLGRE